MSYHVHNLEKGDVFSAPASLEEYADYSYPKDAPFYHWKVTKATRVAGDGMWRVQAKCIAVDSGHPGFKKLRPMDQFVSGDISLCMVEAEEPRWSYREISVRVRWAIQKHLPTPWLAFHPSWRPGARALREAIWNAGPGGELVRALEAGSYSPLVNGSELKVESLESVMRTVTFTDSHIKLNGRPITAKEIDDAT